MLFRSARAAIGVAALPKGASIEVEGVMVLQPALLTELRSEGVEAPR